jgi:hypothetical protein
VLKIKVMIERNSLSGSLEGLIEVVWSFLITIKPRKEGGIITL